MTTHHTLPTAATRQFALLVRAEIDPQKLDSLRTLLGKISAQTNAFMRGEDTGDKIIPFEQMNTIHFARFVIVDDQANSHADQVNADDEASLECPPLLVLSTNYDGPVGEDDAKEGPARSLHLDQLIAVAEAGLHDVFSHCCNYPGKAQLKSFMAKRYVKAKTFYIASSGRSRDQILAEKTLRQRIQAILNDDILTSVEGQNKAPAQIRREVIAKLAQTEEFGEGIPTFPAQPDLSARAGRLEKRFFRIVALVYGALILAAIFVPSPWSWIVRGVLALAVVLPIIGLLAFRYKEKHDVPFEAHESAKSHEYQQWASANENLYHQNQLTHMVTIKPGMVRWILIRGVWIAIQNLATNLFNKGKLGDIPTIQFARWAMIGQRRVLFMSNFDASWQSYLGDFIDKASAGLTAVWSNTTGYPRTRWLVEAGSRDASRFLAWTRFHQLPTAVWYSAYPALSIINVNDNTEIRRGVADPSAIDAATWLYWLRAVDKKAADELTGHDQTREPSLDLDNIQGIILRGYGHKLAARFLMYRVNSDADLPALRRWIGALPLTAAAQAPAIQNNRHPFTNIAFSHRGLCALDLDKTLLARFPIAFVQDSHDEYRRHINGDTGDNDSDRWDWGTEDNGVDLVVLAYADTEPKADDFAAKLHEQTSAWLTPVVADLRGGMLHGRKEHFGFRDGIGQPIVAGSERAESHDNTVAAGEFLLGHRDGYGNVFHGPTSANGFNFGLDGSYLVFRQLSQNVQAFWSYCADQPAVGDAVTVASKMIGRWPSGATLLRHPDKDPDQPRFQDEDDFAYLENGPHNDRYGARCPFGSHVRRSNPRDWEVGINRQESLRLSHLHRIIRRARPYGTPLDEELSPQRMIEAAQSGNDSKDRGIHFLAFNANLERQFEFVQQQWASNSKFSHFTSGADAVLGPYRGTERGTEAPTFTTQTNVDQHTLPQCTGLDSFVNVRGSTYFFMPSLTAVGLIANSLAHPPTTQPVEHVPANEQVHIDSLVQRLREKMKADYQHGKTLRDAHPKMHGCVEATFTVAPDLADDLRVGVFREQTTFDAWVRLSNADGSVKADADKDIRGLAIKLLGVKGPKLIDGEETSPTNDLLLISHPTFITKDVAEFDGLVGALFGSLWAKLSFFATHISVLKNVRKSLKKTKDLLALEYFSASPYLFGARAAKYKLVPQHPGDASTVDSRAPNFLRKRLTERLEAQSVSFDFLVQFQDTETAQPVEDPTVEWTTPFTKLATLTLTQQQFDTPARDRFGENLAFNPWRCLAEHRPLGGINRARRQVYATLSKFRHERNLVDLHEPGSDADIPLPDDPQDDNP